MMETPEPWRHRPGRLDLLRALLTAPLSDLAREPDARVARLVSFCREEGLQSLLAPMPSRGDGEECFLPASVQDGVTAWCRRQRASALRLERIAATVQVVVDGIAGLEAVFAGPLFRRHRYPGCPLPAALPEIRLLVLSDGGIDELHEALRLRGFVPASRTGRHRLARRLQRQTVYRHRQVALRVHLDLAGRRIDRHRVWLTRAQQTAPGGQVSVLSHEYALLEQLLTVAPRMLRRRATAFDLADLFFMLRALDATMDWPAFFTARTGERLCGATRRAAAAFLDALDLRRVFPALAASAPRASARAERVYKEWTLC